MNKKVRELQTYPMDSLVKAKEELKKAGKRIYDFGTGDPKEPTDPKIREALVKAIPEVSQYPTVKGRKDLREAIANWFFNRFHVLLDPETEVIPTAGSKEAIFHFPLVFIDTDTEKKKVIFGTPAYPVYERGTLFAGGEPYPVTLKFEEQFLLRLDKLPKSLLEETAIVWINYPHNPTGAVAPISYLEDTYNICREYGIILCSDECYTEIYFETPPHSLLEVGKKGAVVFHSLSKRSGMTGYRSGFVAGDSEIIQNYLKYRSSFGVASQDFIQQAAKVAWSDEEHVKERRAIFGQKRDIFVKFFKEIGLEFLYPEATFYLWVKVPNGISSKEYALHLLKYGIVISPGEFFGKGGKGFFRIALVPTLKECKEAVDIWKKAHKELMEKKNCR
ncbi:succinyldiaminopimelate transaminase [Desulfurobacterium thermolithotrophum DSM 11699]|uniref:Succinyldiaminopimelate transaminase n=1 Tax=Desulfurobacterium thermolithotrophum (strain DSM 11699 / BSA) TaxID=868864 RepID=F0S3I4_DESTD|nr:succinyldiaminopimelate transaminase [Desulfurobacterium thermolithotrophum]ADY73406.1 succinyldiaminopimelate transaminase [Desulfurobacterium thermolithotrophum DSM 11699]